jgi:hypothetical protein
MLSSSSTKLWPTHVGGGSSIPNRVLLGVNMQLWRDKGIHPNIEHELDRRISFIPLGGRIVQISACGGEGMVNKYTSIMQERLKQHAQTVEGTRYETDRGTDVVSGISRRFWTR